MVRLEDLSRGAAVRGVLPDRLVTVVDVKWIGTAAIELTYKTTDWDLIVCDEAHKMSASFYGIDVKYTKRYRLGEILSGITRHFLLLTATPHNGKEEDYALKQSQ